MADGRATTIEQTIAYLLEEGPRGEFHMIGATLQNRYRIDSELGRGGMGTVYRAHDTLLDRDVAVKVLSTSGLGTEGRTRLLREAQAAKLNHPNIVAVYDVGEADGAPFVVMELVEGESLRRWQTDAIDRRLLTAVCGRRSEKECRSSTRGRCEDDQGRS